MILTRAAVKAVGLWGTQPLAFGVRCVAPYARFNTREVHCSAGAAAGASSGAAEVAGAGGLPQTRLGGGVELRQYKTVVPEAERLVVIGDVHGDLGAIFCVLHWMYCLCCTLYCCLLCVCFVYRTQCSLVLRMMTLYSYRLYCVYLRALRRYTGIYRQMIVVCPAWCYCHPGGHGVDLDTFCTCVRGVTSSARVEVEQVGIDTLGCDGTAV